MRQVVVERAEVQLQVDAIERCKITLKRITTTMHGNAGRLKHAESMKQISGFHRGLAESGCKDTEGRISERRRSRLVMFLYKAVKYRMVIVKLLRMKQGNKMKAVILELINV
jgi:hypothetical protein